MEKLCLFLIFAVLSSQALGMTYRHRRQAESNEENLEDRYGWNRPSWDRPVWDRPVWDLPQRPVQPRPWRPNQPTQPEPRPFPPQNPPQNPPQIPQEPTPFPPQNPTVPPQDQPTPTPNTNNQETTRDCLRRCPVTSEYNPLCGTNNVTYDNPSRLACAQACGTTVDVLRTSRCPPTTPAN